MSDLYVERQIATVRKDDAPMSVVAQVLGRFAYHRTSKDRSERYAVTHIPTGYAIVRNVSVAAARRVIAGLVLLPGVDWSSTDPTVFDRASIADAVGRLLAQPDQREPMIHHLQTEPFLYAAIAAPEHARCGVLTVASGDYLVDDMIVFHDEGSDRTCLRRITHIHTLVEGPVALSLVDPDSIVRGWEPIHHPISPTVNPGPPPAPWGWRSCSEEMVTIVAEQEDYLHYIRIGEVRTDCGGLVVAAPLLRDAARRAFADAQAGQLLSGATCALLKDALQRADDTHVGGLRPEPTEAEPDVQDAEPPPRKPRRKKAT